MYAATSSEAYDGLEEVLNKIAITSAGKEIKHFAQFLLDKCTSPVAVADIASVPHQLPPTVLQILHTVVHGRYIPGSHESAWVPPPFNDVVFHFRFNYKNEIEHYEFGTLDGTPIEGVMLGGVMV